MRYQNQFKEKVTGTIGFRNFFIKVETLQEAHYSPELFSSINPAFKAR